MSTLKNISWKVRLHNPLWWGEVVSALLLPTLVGLGLNLSDINSWALLWDIILELVSSPALIASTLISVFNAITDPTTKGVQDSVLAMDYEKPRESR